MLEILTQTSCTQLTYAARNGFLQADIFKMDGSNINYQEKVTFILQPQVCIYIKNALSELITAYENKQSFKNEVSIKPYKDTNVAVKVVFTSGIANDKPVVRLHISAISNKTGVQMVSNIDKLYDIKAIEQLLGMWQYSSLLFDMFKLQDVINFRTANKNGSQRKQAFNTVPPQQQPITQSNFNNDFGFENGFDAPVFEPQQPMEKKTAFQNDENIDSNTMNGAKAFTPPVVKDENIDDILSAIDSFEDYN